MFLVIRWNNFEDRRKGGDIKPRWFIYLGDSGYFSIQLVIYICTTTTKESDFQKGGKRENHSYIKFSASNTPFEEDCILDFDESPFIYPKEKFANDPDIENIGILDDNTLRSIYKRILKSQAFSKIAKHDIHESLNVVGIENLKKPK